MRLRLLGRLTVVAALAACAPKTRTTPPPGATPAPIPAPSTPTAATSAPAASRFVFLPGAATYDVRSDASIDMTSGPQTERGRERSTTAARVTYELGETPRGTVNVTGQVDALSTQASARLGGNPAAPPTPVRFHGSIDTRSAQIEAEGAVFGCGGPPGLAQDAALVAARETLLRMPVAIAVAARWRDSVTVTTCRGPVPTTVTSIARYEVTAIDGPRVQVRRETTVRLRGQAIAGGRNVTVSGGGGGTATIELDATLGRLTRVDDDTRTTITVTLPDGAREFTEQLHTEVRAR